jgi:hypothetical protein
VTSDALARYERIETALPLPSGPAALPAHAILIGAPDANLERFRGELSAAGIDAGVLHLTGDGWSTAAGMAIALDDHEQLSVELARLRSSGGRSTPILFLTAPGTTVLEAGSETEWTAEVDRNAVGLFCLAKAIAGSSGGLAATGHLGVLLTGDASAADVAARGVARALGHEWRDAGIAVASLSVDDVSAADPIQVLRILLTHGGVHDLALRGGALLQARAVRRDLPDGAAVDLPLGRGAVALLYGGGVGIAAEVGVDLAARHGATVVALGRTHWSGDEPYPDAPTDGALAEAVRADLAAGQDGRNPSAPQLQEALTCARRQRELARTAARIRQAGGRFEYLCADVTSGPDVERALTWVREQLGPIEVVVHAAGIVEDRLLGAKSVDSFRRVLHTKARSAFHLRRVLRDCPPRIAAFFSSLVAHTGNAGQTDYCAANEVLGAIAGEWSRGGTVRAVSLLWSVWTETGLAGRAVKSLMKRHDLAGITSRDGVGYFRAELARAAGPSWVLVSSPRTLEVVERGPLASSPEPQVLPLSVAR